MTMLLPIDVAAVLLVDNSSDGDDDEIELSA